MQKELKTYIIMKNTLIIYDFLWMCNENSE